MTDVVSVAESLIAQPSLTGAEAPAVGLASQWFRERGWTVTLQELSPSRANIWASHGLGSVTLSTHLDTVPPFTGPRRMGNRLTGRGACDAKGIVAAMMVAANSLAEAGETLLDVQLASGAKGSMLVTVRTHGRAAHSAYPELGDSALTPMLSLLATLGDLDLPADPRLGSATINVGTLNAGRAANIVPDEAVAQLTVRHVGDPADVRGILDRWGTPLLVGPGSIHVAHTADEFIDIDELRKSVGHYMRRMRTLLAS